MSVMIFISEKDSSVRVLQWFCTTAGRALESPCGPLLHFEPEEFRRVGLDLVREHFLEHRTKRLGSETVIHVFKTPAEKRTLSGQRVVHIVEEGDGRTRLIPIEVEKLSLAGLGGLPEATHQYVPVRASQDDFWAAFDRALSYSIPL